MFLLLMPRAFFPEHEKTIHQNRFHVKDANHTTKAIYNAKKQVYLYISKYKRRMIWREGRVPSVSGGC
jgi:hypothetical protein